MSEYFIIGTIVDKKDLSQCSLTLSSLRQSDALQKFQKNVPIGYLWQINSLYIINFVSLGIRLWRLNITKTL